MSWLTGLCAENRGRSNLGAGCRYTESAGGGLREVFCGRCVLQDGRGRQAGACVWGGSPPAALRGVAARIFVRAMLYKSVCKA